MAKDPMKIGWRDPMNSWLHENKKWKQYNTKCMECPKIKKKFNSQFWPLQNVGTYQFFFFNICSRGYISGCESLIGFLCGVFNRYLRVGVRAPNPCRNLVRMKILLVLCGLWLGGHRCVKYDSPTANGSRDTACQSFEWHPLEKRVPPCRWCTQTPEPVE